MLEAGVLRASSILTLGLPGGLSPLSVGPTRTCAPQRVHSLGPGLELWPLISASCPSPWVRPGDSGQLLERQPGDRAVAAPSESWVGRAPGGNCPMPRWELLGGRAGLSQAAQSGPALRGQPAGFPFLGRPRGCLGWALACSWGSGREAGHLAVCDLAIAPPSLGLAFSGANGAHFWKGSPLGQPGLLPLPPPTWTTANP